MLIPDGCTAESIQADIERCVDMLSHRFVFGYYERDDISQMVRMFAIEALPRYEPRVGPDGVPTRPLVKFLYRHTRNRLLNHYRDKCQRNDPPCALCHQGRHEEHPDGEVCVNYRKWRKRNKTKAHLLTPSRVDTVADEHESSLRLSDHAAQDASLNEMLSAIDEQLDLELRPDYLRMRAGEHVPKDRRLKVEAAILKIVGSHE